MAYNLPIKLKNQKNPEAVTMDKLLKLSLALALVTLLACQAISTAIHHVADVTGTAVAADQVQR
jgi:hypothetical protein